MPLEVNARNTSDGGAVTMPQKNRRDEAELARYFQEQKVVGHFGKSSGVSNGSGNTHKRSVMLADYDL